MRILVFFLFLLLCNSLSAQTKSNSPYSRFGMGDQVNQYFANAAAWGGQSAAFHDPFHLNLDNPASFAYLKSTALETGIYSKFSQYQSSTSSQDVWSGNLAYLALGFTLKIPSNGYELICLKNWFKSSMDCFRNDSSMFLIFG
jgi:hypothetical protein